MTIKYILLKTSYFILQKKKKKTSEILFLLIPKLRWCFPHGSVVKNLLDNAGDSGDVGLILGSGRSLGGGNGNPVQYSCLGNPMDRGAWRAIIQEVAKSWTQLSTCTHMNGGWKVVCYQERMLPNCRDLRVLPSGTYSISWGIHYACLCFLPSTGCLLPGSSTCQTLPSL